MRCDRWYEKKYVAELSPVLSKPRPRTAMTLRTISKIVAIVAVVVIYASGCGSEVPGEDFPVTVDDDQQNADEENDEPDQNTDHDDESNDGDNGDDGENNSESNNGDNNSDPNDNGDNGDDGENNDESNNDEDNGDDGDDACTDLSDPDCSFDCEDLSTWPDEWLEDAVDVVEATNDVRQEGTECESGYMPPVEPLDTDAALEEAARCHSLDMADKGYFDHVDPDGGTVEDRVEDAGYDDWQFIGENIAMGQTTPEGAVDSWLESDMGHCEGLMNEDFEEIGVGVVVVGGTVYWTQNFGARL